MSDTFTGETYSTLCDDAEEYLAKESPEQARELLQKAISLIGTRPRARSILADTCMSMELWSEAREQLETLITLEEGNINNHFRLAQVLEEIGEYQLALDNYSVVLSEDPEHHGAEVAKKRIENRTSQSGVNLADVFNTPTEDEVESSEDESEEEDIKEGMQIYPDVPSDDIFAESDEEEEDDDVDALLKNIGLSGDNNEAEKEEDEVSELLANIGVSTSQALQSAFGDSDDEEGVEEAPEGEDEASAAEAGEKKKVVSLDEIFGTPSESAAAAETEEQDDAAEEVPAGTSAEDVETEEQDDAAEEVPAGTSAEDVETEEQEAEIAAVEEEVAEEQEEPEAETAAVEEEVEEEQEEPEAETAAVEEEVAEEQEEPEPEAAVEEEAEQEEEEEPEPETADAEETASPFAGEEEEDKGGFVFGTSKTLEAIFSSGDEESAAAAETEEQDDAAEEVPAGTSAEDVETEEQDDAAEEVPAGTSAEDAETEEQEEPEPEAAVEEEAEQEGEEEVSEEQEEPEAETAEVEEEVAEEQEEPEAETAAVEEEVEEEKEEPEAETAAEEESEQEEEEEPEPEEEEEIEKTLLEHGADIRFDPWTPESGLLAVHMTSGELEIESSLISFIEKSMEMEIIQDTTAKISGEGTFLLNCGQYKPLVLETADNMVIRKDSVAVHTGSIILELLDLPQNESLFVVKEDSKEIAVMKADQRTRVILLGGSNRIFFARRDSIVATDPGITLSQSDSPEGFIEISGNGKVYLLE